MATDNELLRLLGVNQEAMLQTLLKSTAVVMRSLSVGSPEYVPNADGTMGRWVVPVGKEWRFSGMAVYYTASSTVVTRQMAAILNIAGQSMRFVASSSQTAGQDNYYMSAPGLVDYSASRRQTLTICTAPLILPPAAEVQFVMLSGSLTDTWTGYSLFVQERSL
jgi:hypothetical protein